MDCDTDTMDTQHRSLVIIWDCSNQNAITVYVFIKTITDVVNSISASVNKVFYFSDGAAQQFKNFVNFYYHVYDFDIPGECHFWLIPIQKVHAMVLLTQ